MPMPSKHRVETAAIDLAVAVSVQAVMLKVAQRLRRGRQCPDCGAVSGRRRPVRRLTGAVLLELADVGVAELYWRRQRRMAAVEDRVAAELEAAGRARRPELPQQRRASEATRRRAPAAPTTPGAADANRVAVDVNAAGA